MKIILHLILLYLNIESQWVYLLQKKLQYTHMCAGKADGETEKNGNGRKFLGQVWEKVKTGNLISSLIIYGTYTQHIKIIKIYYFSLLVTFSWFLNNVQITTAVLMKKWALQNLKTQIDCVSF